MKLLFVCHRFPYPPDRGGRIRPFNMIRYLARRHEVTVAAPTRSPAEIAAAAELRTYCHKLLTAPIGRLMSGIRMVARLPTATPSSFGYFHSTLLARQIDEELRRSRYDLVFGHCSSIAPYLVDASLPKILDFGDMDSQKWLAFAKSKPLPASLGYLLEGRKLERRERLLARGFDLCLCTTDAEIETLRRLAPACNAAAVWNGVDAEYFAPVEEPYDPELICFLGRMDYYPNQECMQRFCRDVLPGIRAQRPGVRLNIVGGRPSRRIRALGGLAGVTVTGTVPDVRPFAQRAALTVAPLKIARGTQNKILESLAMGIPVISSAAAAAGIDAVADEHLLVANEPAEWVAAVLRLLNDKAERQRLASAGRARVLSHHSWRTSMTRLEELILTVGRK